MIEVERVAGQNARIKFGAIEAGAAKLRRERAAGVRDGGHELSAASNSA